VGKGGGVGGACERKQDYLIWSQVLLARSIFQKAGHELFSSSKRNTVKAAVLASRFT